MRKGAAARAGCAALVALSLTLSPALAASTEAPRAAKPRPVLLIRPGGFTPAISDPRLAAELARRGLQANSFRLTPATVSLGSNKGVRVGGSYRLTHNLDLTGGVRYKIQHDRLEPLTDQRRDSQAVYIGTAFRF